MQIMIKLLNDHEPKILNNIYMISEAPQFKVIDFFACDPETKQKYCTLSQPIKNLEYFKKVGD